MRWLRKIEQPAKTFNVIPHLKELVVNRGVGNRRHMKDRVESFIPELAVPIEFGQIGSHHISPESGKVFEVAGTEIIDDGQASLGQKVLESHHQIGSNEAGAARDQKVKSSGR